MTELFVAMALLSVAVLPIAYSVSSERRALRSGYTRAVAMEIVDGEMEVLMAGEWRAFQPGTHEYPVRALAATNLPPGRFTLTLDANNVRLEWQPADKGRGGPVVRERAIR